MEIAELSETLHRIAGAVDRLDAAVSSDAAAHAWIMAATGTWHGEPARYVTLPVRRIRAVTAATLELPEGVSRDEGAVAEVIEAALPTYSTTVRLPRGPELRVVVREAALAQLLAPGDAGIPLAGLLLRVANEPPIDPDVVREILKAARLGDRFQPLLELLAA